MLCLFFLALWLQVVVGTNDENLYSVLGLKFTNDLDALATRTQIQEAYENTVAERRGVSSGRIETALEVLSNPMLRQIYDNLHYDVVEEQEKERQVLEEMEAAVQDVSDEVDLLQVYRQELDAEKELFEQSSQRKHHKLNFHKLRKKSFKYQRVATKFSRDTTTAHFSIIAGTASSLNHVISSFERKRNHFNRKKEEFKTKVASRFIET